MDTPWDPNTPFKNVIDQIKEAVEFADSANQPFTPEQILTKAYNLVYATGLYKDKCKEWTRKPAVDKNWNSFETFMLTAQAEQRIQQDTAAQARFHQGTASGAIDLQAATDALYTALQPAIRMNVEPWNH